MSLYQRNKISTFLGLFIALMISYSALSQQSPKNGMLAKIKMVIAQQEVIINLFDTPASRQLLTQLPLTLDFSDYAGMEKIAYLPQKIVAQHSPNAAQLTGDFTYYAPWGNLAIFYKGTGHDSNLYHLGYIESGKDKLATIKQNFIATISQIE